MLSLLPFVVTKSSTYIVYVWGEGVFTQTGQDLSLWYNKKEVQLFALMHFFTHL